MPPREPRSNAPKVPGAWIPWPIVEALCRLRLRRPSCWQVMQAVLCTQQRYGGREARLRVADIVRLTGLAECTVRRALRDLTGAGLLSRPRRYGALKVRLATPGAVNTATAPEPRVTKNRAVNIVTAPSGRHDDRSPTSLYVSCIRDSSSRDGDSTAPFSQKQLSVISDVIREASDLLGDDALDLALPAYAARKLGIQPGHTYRDAFRSITGERDTVKARDYVAAVLTLRSDPRVQGQELREDTA